MHVFIMTTGSKMETNSHFRTSMVMGYGDRLQQNLNDSNTDDSFIMTNSNSFFTTLGNSSLQ